MFKGRVQFYQNINGKEKWITKDFDNLQDYENFIKSNRDFFPELSDWMREWSDEGNLLAYIENMFQKYFGGKFSIPWATLQSSEEERWLPVDLSYYQKALSKIENQKREKETKRKRLEDARKQIEEYISQLESHKGEEWVEEVLKKAEEDIKKIDEELAKL